jgi:UDP-N-acetylmuramate--alanine ligase
LSSLLALSGRRLWFAGIGGAGLSGYAVLSKAWGAEVRGWDRAETPYLEHVRAAGIDVTVTPEPDPPDGWEAIVSTAYRDRVDGRSRAELLAELVAARDAIVVAGAHGKTTTAAMIAFVLDRLGLDPAYVIGGDVPQLGGNAGAGSGWLVVEGDESDRTIAALRPRVAVVTNVDLDHHSEFASRAEVQALFDVWLAEVPVVISEPEPVDRELAVPGLHNRRNAAAALAALEAAGVEHADAGPVLSTFTGVGRRLERRGEVGGVAVYDDYAHNPAKVEAVLAALHETAPGRVLVLFQPHLPSRTRHVARELGVALAGADAVAVADVYAAREQQLEGIDGRTVVQALLDVRPGMPVAWTPDPVDGARFLAHRARAGDVVATVGAGDVDAVVPRLLEELA